MSTGTEQARACGEEHCSGQAPFLHLLEPANEAGGPGRLGALSGGLG